VSIELTRQRQDHFEDHFEDGLQLLEIFLTDVTLNVCWPPEEVPPDVLPEVEPLEALPDEPVPLVPLISTDSFTCSLSFDVSPLS